MRPIFLFAWLCVALLDGCSEPQGFDGCLSNDECGGAPCVAGICRGPARDLAIADAAAPLDLGGDDPSSDGATPLCSPNHDGVIDRDEIVVLVGAGPGYAVNTPGTTIPVDLEPHNGVWDFSSPPDYQGGSEVQTFDQLLSAKGQWWSADFPTASYAMAAPGGQDLLIVMRSSLDGEQALGYVSQSNQATELTYDQPIPLWRFPLAVGKQWTATANVTGRANYVAVVESETWEMQVLARGTTKVPIGTFDSLQLRIHTTQTIGLQRTTRYVYQQLAECYGQLARIRSQDNEASAIFTTAAERRRLALP
jgi:hypothetical protein